MKRDEFAIKMREALANMDEPTDMEAAIFAAGASPETAKLVARMLWQRGYYLVNPDDIDWVDICRFRDELRKGQDVFEDGGGFWVRKIKALFGIKTDPVTNYRDAAKALLDGDK